MDRGPRQFREDVNPVNAGAEKGDSCPRQFREDLNPVKVGGKRGIGALDNSERV